MRAVYRRMRQRKQERSEMDAIYCSATIFTVALAANFGTLVSVFG
jgi:hypothetical protein